MSTSNVQSPVTWVEDNLATMLHGLVLAGSTEDLAPYLESTVAIAGAADFDQVLDLVAFAHRLEGARDSGAFVVATASEVGLEIETGSEVARRLAAVALTQLCTGRLRAESVFAALAIQSCAFSAIEPVLDVLPKVAHGALNRFADGARQQRPPAVDLKRSFINNAGSLPGTSSVTQVTEKVLHDTVSGLRKGTRQALEAASGSLNGVVTGLARVSEEVDLLWWSQYPTSSGGESLPSASGALVGVVAAEVGRRLVLDPPPRGVESLMRAVLETAGADPDDLVVAGELQDSTGLLTPFIEARMAPHPWATPGLDAIAHTDDEGGSASAIDWALQLVFEQALIKVYST